MKKINFFNSITTSITYCLWFILIPPFIFLLFFQAMLPASVRYSNRFFYFVSQCFSWCILRSSFISLKVIGRKNLSIYPHDPAIIVMNHTSALDIPLVQMIVGSYPYTWIGHARYTKIPFFGFIFKKMHIPFEKTEDGNGHRALFSLYQAIKKNR